MTIDIHVGSPSLVIHQGEAVWLAEPDGGVPNDSERGLLFRDTRLISVWQLFADGAEWELLNGGAPTHFQMQVFMSNRAIPAQDEDIPARTLHLALARWLEGGVHEDIDITNNGPRPARFNLELVLRSDFADLFEIKAHRLVRRGRVTTDWSDDAQTFTMSYRNGDFMRGLSMRVHSATQAVMANGRVSFEIELAPGAAWHACLLTDLHDGEETLTAPGACAHNSDKSASAASLAAWRRAAMKLATPNEEFYRLYHTAVDELAALRLPRLTAEGTTAVMPAAGLPWFAALFGRDSLIVAMQSAPMTQEFTTGALVTLGEWQARERDDFRDAEPGKILHELRLGELAHFKLVPHTPYYGTADATLLYLMVLHSAWRWTGRRDLIERLLPVAERCLDWAENWGDRDGDGFQEYQTRSPRGYENMGWKDAGDAVPYPDGTLVRGPKALCELQGYAYAGYVGMAEIFEALGKPERAAEVRGKAEALYRKFNEVFWDEAWGGYVYTLDGEKKPVRTSASNVGHLLWTGIVPPERAGRVVARLMGPDMFSGWGIRTLSSDHPLYNPLAYHNGSVWPHDNGLIAHGFARYGFHAEAAQVARAVSGAAALFALHEIPELYAGLPRSVAEFPVQVPGANVPQAWAAGSAFSFLQALLCMEPDAPRGVLRLTPALPHWMPSLTLRDVHVGSASLDLYMERMSDGKTRVDVLSGGDEIRVEVTTPD